MSNSIPLMEMEPASSGGDYVDPFEAKRRGRSSSRRRAKCQVHYEVIFWVVFGLLTAWCILDRFFVNLYPMTIDFKPLAASIIAKGGRVSPAVWVFDIYGRATGRMFLTVMNALFWTQCKTTENFLMEHHPKWINLGDLRTVQNRTHYILGMFFMAIPMVIHVLLTFVPAMTGVPHNLLDIADVRAGPTKKLAGLVTPFIRFDPITRQAVMFSTVDDIYRIVLMIVLYCIMFPFSISNFARKRWFSMTQWLHIVAAATFTIDMIRRSPHAQVFSPVVVFYFLMDRLIGLFFYRTGEASIIHSEALDQEYTIIFLYVPRQKRRRLLGSGYYFQFPGLEGALEISHPYVCFQNHTGEPLLPEWKNHDAESTKHKFYVERNADNRKSFQKRPDHAPKPILSDEEEEDSIISQETDDVVFFSNWTTAVLVQVHQWNRGTDAFSYRWSQKEIASRIRFWGPYLSEYSFCTPDGRELPPLVLIGTGTGAGFIIDFYMFFSANGVELQKPVTCYFSTNSIGLFQFLTDLTCDKPVKNWHVNAHLTKADDFEADFEDEDEKPGEHDKHASRRDMKLGRLSFMDVLSDAPPDAEVYFNGAPALAWKVQGACATFGLKFRPGHRYASDGIRSCKRTGKCSFTCQCNKFPCCLVY